MARIPRILSPGKSTYHVYNRGNEKKIVFHDGYDYAFFLKITSEVKAETGFELHHFTLMPNHYHLLLTLLEGSLLSKIFKTIGQRYSLYHQKKYERVGHLWQSRFKHKNILNDAYLLTCGIYIELNPVRAGMVKHPNDYLWSSYRHYTSSQSLPIIDSNPFFENLGTTAGQRMENYENLTMSWLPKKGERGQSPFA